MKLSCAALLITSADSFRGKILRRRAEQGSIWVPIALPARSVEYLNPVTGETRGAPPSGALVTAAARVQGYQEPAVTYGAPGEQLVSNATRKSCVPHCMWNCEKPVCEQNCKPVCRAGTCETRCPKMNQTDLEKCHVQCQEPQCNMFCPKNTLCKDNSTLACPKCTTRCEEPQCNFVCNHDVDVCKTVCPEPVCTFECGKTECPHPKCTMACETPPDCSSNPTPPPVTTDEFVVGSAKAGVGQAHWLPEAWAPCSTTCGTGIQTRPVHCSTKHDEDCGEQPKPATSQTCADYQSCQWTPGAWTNCSARCGPGEQTRAVACAGDKCLAARPATTQPCVGTHPECTQCTAVAFGGPNFDGWSLEFKEGEYTVSDMEAMGARCDDISSLKVVGLYCQTTVYEFGDFNGQHKGWEATFGRGAYDRMGLVQGGAKDNDISSLKVHRHAPQGVDQSGAWSQGAGAGGAGGAGDHAPRSSAAAAGALTALLLSQFA